MHLVGVVFGADSEDWPIDSMGESALLALPEGSML